MHSTGVGDEPVGVPVTAAARRLGVSASTLRSWERRYGIAPSVRTTGGHRRYTAAELVRLQELKRLTATGIATAAAAHAVQAPSPRARRLSRQDLARRLASSVAALALPQAKGAARGVLAQYGPAEAWTEVFAPLLREVGDAWQCTGEGVEREHVAADAIQQAFEEYTHRHMPASSSVALLAVPAPDEAHVLPLHALSAALAEQNVPSRVLTALPPVALRAAIDAWKPGVLLLWAQAPETADARLLRPLASVVPAVYVGGPGWSSRRLPAPVTALVDLPGAVAAVRAWGR